MRLIDADALCKKLQEELGSPEGHKKLMLINYLITSAPTIEAEDVRRGKWIEYPECLAYDGAFGDDHIVCSECHHVWSILDNDAETFNYCPNCGARMEVEE